MRRPSRTETWTPPSSSSTSTLTSPRSRTTSEEGGGRPGGPVVLVQPVGQAPEAPVEGSALESGA
ncbi:hypothetical protein ACFQ0B_17850 [Nonomuraea thailandensis]